MPKKAKIYTRTGDKGETGLVGGQRLKKSDDLIELYGTCDELNSFIGLLVCELEEEQKTFLFKIQSELFNLGSLLACFKNEREKYSLPQVEQESVKELEAEIDRIDEKLPPMTHFILPGGHRASACAQVCRAVCRRFERLLVCRDLSDEDLPPNAIVFTNRLSDYFFSLARLINLEKSIEEISWIPNKKKSK